MLACEDRDELQRLCRPETEDFVLNRPDYYAFFTYSLFRGRVASPGQEAAGPATSERGRSRRASGPRQNLRLV
jgi:demethylmenaquinone methyltransferase/2-methoxy-6-polyprenyl-1,4-benzoquinol methylase